MKPAILLPVILAGCAAGAGILSLARTAAGGDRADGATKCDPFSLCREIARGAWPFYVQSGDGDGNSRSRSFRFEFRNDGSGPRYFWNGEEIKPGDERFPGDPFRFFEESDDFPPFPFPRDMEDLLRRFRGDLPELFDEPGDEGNNRDRDGAGDPRRMLEELRRRMRGDRGIRGGQPARETPSRYSKYHLSSLAEWRPLIQEARRATARVLQGERQVALATVVSPEGYALTKASEVGGKSADSLECELFDGRIVRAKVVDTLESYDLALLRLEATGLNAISFAANEPPVGTLVAAVTPEEDPAAIGVVSVPPRNLNDRSKGYLGILMDVRREVPDGVAIQQVTPGGAAERAGIRSGDIVTSVNGNEIRYPTQLQKIITSLQPDEKVTLGIRRGDESLSIELSLGSRAEANLPQMLDTTARMGSSLSENANGYPSALQCDLGINAEDCGGPVVSVDGSVIGINIARAERISTYMIPGATLVSVLADVREGKFELTKDIATLQSDLRESELELRRAEEARREAEARHEAAKAALERLRRQSGK